MKPAPFEYHAARSSAEAVEVLARHGDAAKVLAGGQSLVPMLNFRLARPGVLVDINNAADLDYLREADGVLVVGALGIYFHLRGNVEFALERDPSLTGAGLIWKALRGATPALAPGALAQLGLLGLLFSYKHPAFAGRSTSVADSVD